MNSLELRECITQFLAYEAMLLDEGRFDEWLDTLDDNIKYEAPIRQSTKTRAEEFAGGGSRFSDNKTNLKTRVERLSTGHGYAEEPPSRTVRSVSSVCILARDDDVVSVSSALILYRHRANDVEGDTIHARRNDEIRLTEDGPKLLSRKVIFSEVCLSTPNLGIFL